MTWSDALVLLGAVAIPALFGYLRARLNYPTAGMVPGESPGWACEHHKTRPGETPAVGFDSTAGGGPADAAQKSADDSRGTA